LLLEDIGLSSFSTNEAAQVGAGGHNQDEIGLNRFEQLEAMQILARLIARYPGRITATAGPLAKNKNYAEMKVARQTGGSLPYETGRLTGCGCVFSRLSILHDGTIVPCHLLHRLSLGKIAQDSLQEVWHTHPTLTALRERRDIPLHQVPGCQGCEWAAYCTGNCPGVAHEVTGDFNRANPQDCFRLFLLETGDHYGNHP
jgi:SynChlorMet cassette radical SAM/SPASM protein ScmE